MNIYLSCALTHVPRDTFSTYVATVHAVASGLAAMDTVRRVRYALVDSDPALAGEVTADRPKLCYQWNRRMIEEAHLLIAEVSYPSTGLGIEAEIAASKRIPIIFIYRDYSTNRAVPVSHVNPAGETHELQIGDGIVSLMALGIPSVARVMRYETAEHALIQLSAELGKRAFARLA
jgi:hypothetical protein